VVRTLDLRVNGREVDATNTAMSERGGTASEYQLHDYPVYNVPSGNRRGVVVSAVQSPRRLDIGT